MAFLISQKIKEKLAEKHNVTEREVMDCFYDRKGTLIDDREDHKTDPPTQWFIGMTNKRRLLKVIFINKEGNILLKSAFPPNDTEIAIYERKFGKVD
jgi:uncharacterized DUF497 family protein